MCTFSAGGARYVSMAPCSSGAARQDDLALASACETWGQLESKVNSKRVPALQRSLANCMNTTNLSSF